MASAKSAMTLQAMTETVFSRDIPANEIPRVTKGAMDSIAESMDVKTAVSTMSEKPLPNDVSNLVQKVGADGEGEFTEESMAKARRALNDLIEKAWIELDDKIFKCKGFEDMNRNNYD